MKKKIGVLLLAVSTMSVCGCSSFIPCKREKAIEKMEAISDSLVYTDKVDSLYAKRSIELSTESKEGETEKNKKYTNEEVLKISIMLNYCYTKTSSRTEDLLTGESTVNETEKWEYIFGSKYYLVERTLNGDEESKTYTKTKSNSEAKTNLKKNLRKLIDKSFNGDQRENAINETLDVIDRDEKDEDLSVKYMSNGGGFLSVVANKETSETNEGITTSTEEAYSFIWERYSLKKKGLVGVITTTNEETGDYSKITASDSFQFKTFFIPKYPWLNKYTEK